MPQQLQDRLHRRQTCHLVDTCFWSTHAALLTPAHPHIELLLLEKPVITFLRCICCSVVALLKALRLTEGIVSLDFSSWIVPTCGARRWA